MQPAGSRFALHACAPAPPRSVNRMRQRAHLTLIHKLRLLPRGRGRRDPGRYAQAGQRPPGPRNHAHDEGSREEIETQFKRSLGAFFDFYPEIRVPRSEERLIRSRALNPPCGNTRELRIDRPAWPFAAAFQRVIERSHICFGRQRPSLETAQVSKRSNSGCQS